MLKHEIKTFHSDLTSAMCDSYNMVNPGESSPLDDFQTLKKWTSAYTYEQYYGETQYDGYRLEDIGHAGNVYQELLNPKDYVVDVKDEWKRKYVADWTPQDTIAWALDTAQCSGIPEMELPLVKFNDYPGIALISLTRDGMQALVEYVGVSSEIARINGDILHTNLQRRLKEESTQQAREEAMVPLSVLRFADTDSYQYGDHRQVMLTDLDRSSEENRSRIYDYRNRPQQSTAWDSGDDTEDRLRMCESISPECSYGSDASKSSDELDDKSKVVKRAPGRPKGSGRKIHKRVKNVSVPEFIKDLLLNPDYCPDFIRWEDYEYGKFRFIRPDEVAKLWGSKKQNDTMSFEKFSRAMRYHYRHRVLVPVPSKRLVYQFGPKGPKYQTDDPNFEKSKKKQITEINNEYRGEYTQTNANEFR